MNDEAIISLYWERNETAIEQTDKKELSPVIRSFLPLLSQHIFTMNSLETQLLTELRDSLLPGLMSGRIKIQEP